MMNQDDRVEQFKTEISKMSVADPASGRDRVFAVLGAVLLLIGPLLTLVGFFTSHGTIDPLVQNDATITAIIGLTLTVAGGALFVRYSFAQFLRFWLARLSYESQAQTDRLIETLVGTTTAASPMSAAPTRAPAHAMADPISETPASET